MKLYLLIFATLFSTFVYSQVGINTENPTETLDVNGESRLRNLPQNDTENVIYTKADGSASNTKDQPFNATKTVVANENGVLGVVDGLPETSNTKTLSSFVEGTGAGSTFSETITTLGDLTIAFEYRDENNGRNLYLQVKTSTGQEYFPIQLQEMEIDPDNFRQVSWYDTNTTADTWIDTGKYINGKFSGQWTGTIMLDNGKVYFLIAATTPIYVVNTWEINKFTFRLSEI